MYKHIEKTQYSIEKICVNFISELGFIGNEPIFRPQEFGTAKC